MTPQTQWITPVAKGPVGRDGVADDDPLRPDQDLFDHAPQYLLTIFDRRRLGCVAQPGEELLQVLGQLKVGLAVEELCVQRRERTGQAGLLRAKVGHLGTQLVEGEQVLLVGLHETFDALGGSGEFELEAGPFGRRRIGRSQLFQAPVQLGLDEARVGEQGGHLTPDEIVEVVSPHRLVATDASMLVAVVIDLQPEEGRTLPPPPDP